MREQEPPYERISLKEDVVLLKQDLQLVDVSSIRAGACGREPV
jgi:hypothetical protein